jgi:hypothetical protein
MGKRHELCPSLYHTKDFMMKQNTRKYFWRYLVLLTILFNAIFVHLIPTLNNSQDIIATSETYHLYISPASYTYLIWELIFFVFIVYGIIQVKPSTQDHSIYDSLAVPVIILGLLGVVWVYAFVNDLPLISLSAGSLLLLVAFQSFSEVRSEVNKRNYNPWLKLPFSFLSAALTCLITINLFEYLERSGISQVNESMPLTLTLIVLSIIGLFVHFVTWSSIFPIVIAWFLIGIYAKHHVEAPGFSRTAMVGALLLLIIPFTSLVYRKIKFINNTRSKINAK